MSVETAKLLPSGKLLEAFKDMVDQEGAALLNKPELLLDLAGIKGGMMPERTAPLNEVLDVMPPEWREKFLGNVANIFFHPGLRE
jgi:hypothetical protein